MTTPLHIHLLGTFRLASGDAPLTAVNTPRLQALLAYLLLHRAAPPSRQHLAFLLWPDSTDAQARTNLRNLLHLLRRALPEADQFLDDQGPTLCWRPAAPIRLDVAAFEQALDQADQAERATDPPALRAALERAVALYQGPLLPGCYDDWVLPERERLHQRFTTAVERLVAVLEGTGDYRRAIGYAQRLLHDEPLNEATYRQLLRLHVWSGDRAGALRVYRTCAAVLEGELAVEPSPATRELYEQLMRGEELPSPAAVPPAPPTAPSATPPQNLPLQLTSFIGREVAVAEVRRLLAGTRLLTLTGPGGGGKTRLALEVARAAQPEYGGGVWLVELAALADPALVPQAVASALGLREQPGRPLLDTLLDHLRPRHLLLLLDNCEHLVAACAHLAEPLLRACPTLHVLATSREGLGLAGETTWAVPPLTAPNPDHLPPLADLPDYEAIRLFSERAAAALPTFRLSERTAPAVAQVCWRLDGLPLAIELAAARVRALSVEQIAARLDDALWLLSGGRRTALPRHQTLRATIDWSHALLAEAERVLLRRLAVFAGGWTLGAAEAVCADDALPTAEVLEVLAHLIDRSLVLVVDQEQGTEARYRLLETVRQYGWERLREASETASSRRRHANYFLALAEAAAPKLSSPEPLAWLERLEGEHDNLRAALGWLLAEGDLATALRLGVALWGFWYARGYLREGRHWLETILAPATTRSEALRPLRARVLTGAGRLAAVQGDFPAATALLEESLALGRLVGDERELATTLYHLGAVALIQGHYPPAASWLEESLVLGRASGDARIIAYTLNGLGLLASREHRFDEAWALLGESLALNQQLGDQQRAAYTLDSLAWMALLKGDPTAAQTYFAESLTLLRGGGDTFCVASCLEGLGQVAARLGRLERAARLLGAATALREAAGIGPPLDWDSQCEAMIAAARAQLGEAAFDAAHSRGRHLPLAVAIAEALEVTTGVAG